MFVAWQIDRAIHMHEELAVALVYDGFYTRLWDKCKDVLNEKGNCRYQLPRDAICADQILRKIRDLAKRNYSK